MPHNRLNSEPFSCFFLSFCVVLLASPSRSHVSFDLTARERTPPRFGSDLSTPSRHLTLSPLPAEERHSSDTDGGSGSSQASLSPTEIWRRVLQKDTARVVAPVSAQDQAEWDKPLSTSRSPAKKRSLSPAFHTTLQQLISPNNKSMDDLDSSSSVVSESPSKKRKTAATESPVIGRRSARLVNEPKKNLKEPSSGEDEEEEDDEDRGEVSPSVSSSRSVSHSRRGRSRSSSTTRSPTIRRVKDRSDEGSSNPSLAAMRSFFDQLDAKPLEAFFEIRQPTYR